MKKPEELAREDIDAALRLAGWEVQDLSSLDIDAARGVAIREYPLKRGHGFADYLLYVDGEAVGVVEAKPQGTPLTGVEVQTTRYSERLPSNLPARLRALPALEDESLLMRHPFDQSDARDFTPFGHHGWPGSGRVHLRRAGGPGLPKPVYVSDRFVHGSSDTGLQWTPVLVQSTAQDGLQSLMRGRLALIAWLFLLASPWGCASSRASDPDIVRPAPGAPFLEKIPGPMLGPFNSYSDALIAACNKIMRKPNATAGRRDQQDFATRWRASTEYCAWLYYTPDHKYVISKLTDQSKADPTNSMKTCFLPPDVDDSRYPPDSIQYVFALHNHPYEDGISLGDVKFIAEGARNHGHESFGRVRSHTPSRKKSTLASLQVRHEQTDTLVRPSPHGLHSASAPTADEGTRGHVHPLPLVPRAGPRGSWRKGRSI